MDGKIKYNVVMTVVTVNILALLVKPNLIQLTC